MISPRTVPCRSRNHALGLNHAYGVHTIEEMARQSRETAPTSPAWPPGLWGATMHKKNPSLINHLERIEFSLHQGPVRHRHHLLPYFKVLVAFPTLA